MITILNFLINLLIIVCLFIYFFFTTIDLSLRNIEYFLILFIALNLINKIYIWSNFKVFIKKNLNKIFKHILFNVSFAKLNIIILSTVIPIYMLIQKDKLVVDILIEKVSFLLVSLFALIGFYLEFFILEVRKTDD
ncbi:hypothetical protein OA492_02110 [Pelagibacteraceae bacterium]|nr:hypothetical protein [Pelagibacteraceae bacterium]